MDIEQHFLKEMGLHHCKMEYAMNTMNAKGSSKYTVLTHESVVTGAITISTPTGRRATPNTIWINTITFHIRTVSITLLPFLKEH